MLPTKEDFKERAMRQSEEVREEAMKAFHYALKADRAIKAIIGVMQDYVSGSGVFGNGALFVETDGFLETRIRLLLSRRQAIAMGFGVVLLDDGKCNIG